MNVNLQKSSLNGKLDAIASKSQAHRAIICAALADTETHIKITRPSDDVYATISCIQNMGASVKGNNDSFTILPINDIVEMATLNCFESGSTLRFLLPVCAACRENTTFIGEGRLPERPIIDLIQTLKDNGKTFNSEKLPLSMGGMLKAGKFKIPANVSSQYISGLLMALPMLEDDSEIIYTSPPKSTPYIDITTDMLNTFGINIIRTVNGFLVPGNQKFKSPKDICIEGDWSNSAFWLAAGAVNGDVCVNNLDVNSYQGDKRIVEFLQKFGADIEVSENSIRSKKAGMHGTDIDVSETPDLLPILAVVASAAEGKTTLYNAKHLRYKESDRLASTTDIINALGGNVIEYEDKLEIFGTQLTGGQVKSHNDHRIVMSAAIASTICSGQVTILDTQAVNKSYPTFFEDYAALGGYVL